MVQGNNLPWLYKIIFIGAVQQLLFNRTVQDNNYLPEWYKIIIIPDCTK